MKTLHITALATALLAITAPALAQITFYEPDGFRGRTFSTARPVSDFRSQGFNDRASSVVVEGGRWEVCQNSGFGGDCRVLRTGNYASLSAMGLNDQVSSTRRIDGRRDDVQYAPAPVAAQPYEYRRRPNEQVYEAQVTSARAVVGAPTERCWVEREQASSRGGPDLGRTAVGALLGGVIGHQIGGGRGRDLATVGGVVAGAAIGANTGRDREVAARDVRRCTSVPSSVPAYWDVSYNFRGMEHRLQMAHEPGATISVNRAGDPRQ